MMLSQKTAAKIISIKYTKARVQTGSNIDRPHRPSTSTVRDRTKFACESLNPQQEFTYQKLQKRRKTFHLNLPIYLVEHVHNCNKIGIFKFNSPKSRFDLGKNILER